MQDVHCNTITFVDYHCNTIVILLPKTVYACLKEEIKNMDHDFIYCIYVYQICIALTEKYQNIVRVHLNLLKCKNKYDHPCVQAIPSLTIFKLVHVYFMSS